MNFNRFNTFAYVTLFIVFILGVHLRIYNYSIFKLLVPVVTGGLGFYYFANKNYINYIKLAVIVVFLGHNANQYFFLLLTILLFNVRLLLSSKYNIRYIYYMLGMGFISYFINQFVEVNLYSFPFFIASFFFPISFYIVGFKFGNEHLKHEIINFYIGIVVILSITGLYQLTVFGSIADGLTGGTTNAHTLGFHLAVALILLISRILTIEKLGQFSGTQWLIGALMVPLMFFADAKYLLGNMVFAIFIIYVMYHTKKLLKPFLITFVVLGIALSFNIIRDANLTISAKSDVDISSVSLLFSESAKYQLYEKTFNLPYNEPLVFLIGSGPGTFLSRAANSRAFDTMDKKMSTGGGTSTSVESKLPSFIPAHTSWVTKEYAVMYFNQIWYGTLFDFRSSIISLFWEFGIIGFSFFIYFLYRIVKLLDLAMKKFVSLNADAFFIQALIVFYLLNSLIAYYLEYPETQIVFWLFLGLFANKELTLNVSK